MSIYVFCSIELQRTLRAGKLTEKILKLFVATGKEEILSLIESLNIQLVLTPVLPTSKKIFETIYLNLTKTEFDISVSLQGALRTFDAIWHCLEYTPRFNNRLISVGKKVHFSHIYYLLCLN